MLIRHIFYSLLFLFCLINTVIAGPGEDRLRWSAQHDALNADDVEAEIKFGRHIAARMLAKYPLYKDEALTRYINLVGRTVAAQSSRQELEFRFGILDVDSINAYAVPGGFILITKGAVMQAQDEAEIAAIIAHEIAHISERHIVKALNIRANEKQAGAGLARLIGGASDPARIALSQAADQAIDILFAAGLSKADELAADAAAVQLLALTGYDPLALKRFLLRLVAGQQEHTKILNTTHPPSKERIHALDAVISANKLNDLRYSTLKQRFNENVKIKN